MSFDCLVCNSKSVLHYHQEVHNRDFYKCTHCDFVFVDRLSILEFSEERKRYDGHENDKLTDGYEKFLMRLINEVIPRHGKTSKGLDYGSGPYPMLMNLFEREGFKDLTGYDLHYNNKIAYKDETYDFITMCEVFEHVREPVNVITELVSLLKPGGSLIISTGILTEKTNIKTWYYIHDDTHINFFSPKSLEYLGNLLDVKMDILGKDLIIFQKI